MGIFGNDEEKYHDKAGYYFKKGNFEKAIKYLDKGFEINPNSVNALNDKGFALKNIGMFDEATKYFNKALEIEPNQPVILLNKALLLMDNVKNYEEAIKCYDILLKMDKEVFKKGIKYSTVQYPDILLRIWNDKGLALFNLGKYEEAIFCYNESLKMDPNSIDALKGKELAEKELNNTQGTYPNYNAPINNEMNFCPECGTKSIAGAEFCYKCGARLTQTGIVGDISTSVNGSENKNFNYQNTEKSLIGSDKPQKMFKHPLLSIFDTIATISAFLTIICLIGIVASLIILFFIGNLFVYHILEIIIGSIVPFIIIFLISSWISGGLKGRLRQKIMETGIPAKARILEVENKEYDYHAGIRTVELTLEVNPKTGVPYQAKSTVKTYASDASLMFHPGKTVKVFIDPEDASQVEVEY